MKKFKILLIVLLAIAFFYVPDLSQKKDALIAVQIASDTDVAHVAHSANNTTNALVKVGFAALFAFLCFSLSKDYSKEKTIEK